MLRCFVMAALLQTWSIAAYAQSGCMQFGPFPLAENADQARLQQCLEEGLSVSARYGRDRQWTLLQWFLAFSSDPELIRFLIGGGSDPNAVDGTGKTPLHLAAQARQTEAVQLLLDLGVDPDVRDNFGQTPLALLFRSEDRGSDLPGMHRFIDAYGQEGFETRSYDIYQTLISAGADPLATTNSGRTLLHTTVNSDAALPKIVSLLIEAGIDVNATDDNGKTALHETMFPAAVPQVQALLIAAGAALDVRDNEGNRPIDRAFEWKTWPTSVVRLRELGFEITDQDLFAGTVKILCDLEDFSEIVDTGFDFETKGPNGESLFHHFVTCYKPDNYLSALEALGISPLAVDNDGNSPLMAAVDETIYSPHSRDDAAFAFLAAAGADPLQANKAGVTPWEVARNVDLYNEMFDAFVIDLDLDVRDDAGQTSLHRAVLAGIIDGSIDEAEFLIRAGADLDILSNVGDTPLHIALNNFDRDNSEAADMVTALAEAGADLNIKNDAGDTPLHIALDSFDRTNFYTELILTKLLEAGPNGSIADSEGRLPVFKWLDLWTGDAVWGLEIVDSPFFSDEQMVDLQQSLDSFNRAVQQAQSQDEHEQQAVAMLDALLAGPVDIRARDINGKNLLFAALENQHKPGVIMHLLQEGVDPSELGDDGLTALSYVIAQGRDDVAVMILASGVDPDILDATGRTSVHYVAARGDAMNPAILPYLLEAGASFSIVDNDGNLPVDVAKAEVTDHETRRSFIRADREARSLWERWFQ
ncbi:MAG: ankyrin repeat domain-containing protein [Litoreibacter sp.]